MRRAFAALALAATASAQKHEDPISGAERARYKIAALGRSAITSAAEIEDALAMDFRMVGSSTCSIRAGFSRNSTSRTWDAAPD